MDPLRLLIYCAALTNCAPAVVATGNGSDHSGTRDTTASRPVTPRNAATGDCVLDERGLRELLAGFELELGDCRAETARQAARADAALTYGLEEQHAAESANAKTVWVSVVSAVLSAAVAAGITVGVEAAAHR